MSRTIRTRTCKCGAPILVGLDADWLAIEISLDAQPIDQLGEALALLQGRRTYNLRPTATRGSHGRVIEERTAWRIRNPWINPPPIHAQHRCGQPLPAAPPKPTAVTREVEHFNLTAPF